MLTSKVFLLLDIQVKASEKKAICHHRYGNKLTTNHRKVKLKNMYHIKIISIHHKRTLRTDNVSCMDLYYVQKISWQLFICSAKIKMYLTWENWSPFELWDASEFTLLLEKRLSSFGKCKVASRFPKVVRQYYLTSWLNSCWRFRPFSISCVSRATGHSWSLRQFVIQNSFAGPGQNPAYGNSCDSFKLSNASFLVNFKQTLFC